MMRRNSGLRMRSIASNVMRCGSSMMTAVPCGERWREVFALAEAMARSAVQKTLKAEAAVGYNLPE